jgi:hypothetical protein
VDYFKVSSQNVLIQAGITLAGLHARVQTRVLRNQRQDSRILRTVKAELQAASCLEFQLSSIRCCGCTAWMFIILTFPNEI